MKSLAAKLNFLYAFLSIMNLAFFTMILYENQIDLITAITRYETREKAEDLYAQFHMTLNSINGNMADQTAGSIIENLVLNLKEFPVDFIIFTKEGVNLFQSNSEFYLKKEHLADALEAFREYDARGRIFYSRIIKESSEMLFFVPVRTLFKGIEEFVFFFKLKADIAPLLTRLYRLILFFLGLSLFVYILFVLFLHRIVIVPLKTLVIKSSQLGRGNSLQRLEVPNHDEIGQIFLSFNGLINFTEKRVKRINHQLSVMQRENKAAAMIQKTVYAQSRTFSFFDLAVYHKPFTAVSGDFYDIIPLDKNRYGILIADATGHGVSTALTVMLIKNRFETLAPQYVDLKEMMKKIHYSFKHLITDHNKFFTAFYMVIDRTGVISFSNSAHPRPFILRPGVKGYKILDTDGFFVGLPTVMHTAYDFKRIRLMAGDKIILYTDGIISAHNRKHKPYGIERLQTVAARNVHHPSALMLENILLDFRKYTSHAARRDDETLLIIEVK